MPKFRWYRRWPNRCRRCSTSCSDLAVKARPFAEKDIADLRAFARANSLSIAWKPGISPTFPKSLLQARYAFSEQEVKQYFTEDKVLAGLIKVIESLFGVRIKPDRAPTMACGRSLLPHRDASRRVDRSVLPRPLRPRNEAQRRLDGRGDQSPQTAAKRLLQLTRRYPEAGRLPQLQLFSTSRDADGRLRPATFTHDEVITLFHETGHGLHHLLTHVDELGVAGIHGVEWDAVELPSQFMENYCWEWSVLQDMTAHIDTGEPLPRALFDKMLAAKNFLSGMQTLRQVEFSLFDLRLHSDFDPAGDRSVLELLAEVRREVAVLVPPAWHRFPNSFAHIFAGGYGAGYYSYKWAEVLSADCYGAFEEAGNPFDSPTGQRFLRVKSWRSAAAGRRSTTSGPSVAATHRLTRCFGTVA
jgi:oligopeptidase A